ncbi:pro-epidermal growth factor-like isoform X1 [Tigriopus californicus]|uniref:pro-epidermal growth factor-like isoform X1 n=1 Tax=Tigriopus californicus TaxID=6832 RepID=UPI0027DA5853|nr:pro-epidermal growth factor-like isoform X1 [Tigriopus californicus]
MMIMVKQEHSPPVTYNLLYLDSCGSVCPSSWVKLKAKVHFCSYVQCHCPGSNPQSLVTIPNKRGARAPKMDCSESCSSRSTPKPRPPSQSAIRPNITFQTYACPPAYAAWYCLNGATCFTVKIADSILYNCECADGYMGQRCEFKDLDGTYLPTRERFLMLRNSRVGQAMILVLTIVITAVIISAIVTKMRTRSKLRNLAAEAAELQQQNQYRMSGDSIFSIGMSESSTPGHDVMGQSISYQLSASCHDNSPYQLWPRRPDQNVPRIRGSGTTVLMDETSFCNQRTSLSSSSASLTTARRAPMMQSRIS